MDDDAYWIGAIEEDTINTFTSPGAGGFGGVQGFLPPPPMSPSFLDHLADLDRLDSCDLCSWSGAEDVALSAAAAADASQGRSHLFPRHKRGGINTLWSARVCATCFSFRICRVILAGSESY